MRFNKTLFKEAMTHKGLKQKDLIFELSKKGIDISIDTIKYWTRTASDIVPEMKTLFAIGKILGVYPLDLLLETGVTPVPVVDAIKIPILEGLAGCGSAGVLEQLRLTSENMVIDKRIFPSDIISKNLAMIRIVGDSMQPYLDENDWAVVQMRNGANVVLTGAVYLLARGDDVQIKRCTFRPDGTCVIISDNQLYPIEEACYGEWEVLGKVVARLKVGSPFLVKE